METTPNPPEQVELQPLPPLRERAANRASKLLNRLSRLGTDNQAAFKIFAASIDRDLEQDDPLLKIKTIGILFLLSNIFVVILTIIPVVVKTSPISNPPYPSWYGSNDVLRLLEPIIALPLQLLLLLQAPIFTTNINREGALLKYFLVTVFAACAAVYQQGAGFHSASILFKSSIVTLRNQDGAVAAYPIIEEIYDWMRNEWEHLIAHYMYAAGGIALSFLYAYVFRQVGVSAELGGVKDWKIRSIYGSAFFLYGIIVGSVAIQFLSGSIVALVLIIVYGFGVLGGYLMRKEGRKALVFGNRIVLQSYLASYFFAFLIVIGWIIANKGDVTASRN